MHATASRPLADAEPPTVPITLPMFRAMVRAGIIGEKDPVFLWKGRLARRMAPNRPHSIAVSRSRDALAGLLPAGYHVQQEQPVARTTEPSAPEPDLAILRGRPEDYPEKFPTTADMPMAVEVADSSLSMDLAQADDYAREGVPVYWVLDLQNRRLEVRDDPAEGGYRRSSSLGEDDETEVILDGRLVGRVRVGDLIP